MSGLPAGAFDLFMRETAPESRDRRKWTPEFGAMPAIYLSHGAPPLFEDSTWIEQLHAWANRLPVPTGIVIVSAHWEAAPIAVTRGEANTPLVYDFAGFDPHYYTMTYPTPDATWLSDQVVASLTNDSPVHTHQTRGLDHGAWVPLKVMYPYADVPVVQLSMPTHDPERLMAVGARLRELRDHGILVIGSGFMTHGLPYLTADMFFHNVVPDWSAEFDAWAADALDRADVDELMRYRNRAPAVRYAHPTVEHFTPLFVTLGAADADLSALRTAVDGYAFGLSRRSFELPAA